MDKTFGKAFSYMFKDEDWRGKAGILFVMYLVVSVFVCTFISSLVLVSGNLKDPSIAQTNNALNMMMPICDILIFFIVGYLARCTHNVIKNDGSFAITLPKWGDGFLNNFIIGGKQTGAYLAVLCLILPSVLILGIPFLIFWFLSLALYRLFCEDFKFDSYFAWKQAFELVRNNLKLYIGVILTVIFLNLFLLCIVAPLFYFKISSSLIAILMAAYATYQALIIAYLRGIIGETRHASEPVVTTND